ncbi:hypothetical protein SAMN05421642_10355 [Rhodococcoides kyotonense]|uniref:Uncharacterized protein n=1 Tax=Rhodococcoides kyotonense TaxID=398843 RepID=A0A239F1T9_9NOCA|nr:hypothetical protein SAMN05421642_10355 [Rhodococcus kyotonensis]
MDILTIIGTGIVAFIGSSAATALVQSSISKRERETRRKQDRIANWQRGIEGLRDFNINDEHEPYEGPDAERHELVWKDALDLETKAWYLDYQYEALEDVRNLVENSPSVWKNNDRARDLVKAIMPDIARIREEWKV